MKKKKLKGYMVAKETPNMSVEQIEQLKRVFPHVFTEEKIDWDKLRETFGKAVDERPERYSFNWAGKRDAIQVLQMPTRSTLVPDRDESVNFDTTQNIFIEGDNLEALKLLYKGYFGRVKMIYIDPPYNTGSDFIYPDNYSDPLDSYLKITCQKDSAGNLLTSNPETSGRFHSAWLSMMYPRVFVARQLLSDDGVILVSIDDRELFNLRILLNEIFGEENYLTTFVWVNEGNIDNQSRFKRNHEYIVAYAKHESSVPHPPVIDPNIPKDSKLFRDYIDNTIVKNGPGNPVTDVVLPQDFPANFEKGVIEPKEDFWPKLDNPVHIDNYKTKNQVVVSSGWSSRLIFEKFVKNGLRPVLDTKGQESTFYISETGAICVRKKRLEIQSHVLTILRNMGTVQAASSKLADIGISFDYPKPVELLKYLVKVGGSNDGIIMDFFGGCCPLAQAILELNREDENNRHFIMVQLPEPTPENSSERKSGFDTISDIGKERIRRVISEMKKANEGKLPFPSNETPEDLGFKVFKLAESNFRQWSGVEDSDIESYAEQMALFTDPLIDGWEIESVIYEVAIKEGLSLSSSIEPVEDIPENTVFCVIDQDKEQSFTICLDNKISDSIIQSLDLKCDDLFICRDVSISDKTAANLALQCRLKII